MMTNTSKTEKALIARLASNYLAHLESARPTATTIAGRTFAPTALQVEMHETKINQIRALREKYAA